MKIAVCAAEVRTMRWQRKDMIEEFLRRGHEVVCIADAPEDEWTPYFREWGVSYRQFYVVRNGVNPLQDMRTLRSLERVFREERPDRLFTCHPKANIYGSIAAHRAGVPGIYCMVGGLGSIFNSDSAKAKAIRPILSAEYRRAFRHADKVFFQNREDVEKFTGMRIVSPAMVVMTRGSGVNIEHFAQQPLPDRPSFLFVGRLVKGKGVFEYLEASRMVKAAHPQAEFHLVGPFDSNPTSLTPEQLQSYVDEGTVVYHGEEVDVRPSLAQCSCFVLPSYYGEGTPKSALEAMATGRPLIVADAVGCREVVRNGVNGFLSKPRDSADLAAKMLVVAEDDALASKMAEASRKMAEDLFDVRKVDAVICETMGV